MIECENDKVKVLVCQHGSRHRYAIPRMLEEAGMLAGLYTDSTVFSPLGRLAAWLSKAGVNGPRMQALLARQPAGVPPDKLFSSDRIFFSTWRRSKSYGSLSYSFKRWGLQDANVIYNMFGEDRGFLEWAKTRGCKIIVDVFVHPDTERIVAEEHHRWFGAGSSDNSGENALHEHLTRTFSLADLLSCPSSWVADGVRDRFPEHAHKIRVVPYGSSLRFRSGESQAPVPGRILFAGREPFRKGLHYLADASRIVREHGVSLDVRVAGVEEKDVRWMKSNEELHCLGSVPMGQMEQEYNQATAFILPSLSEGQAGVLLEAMASGCPVIATRESGVDFEPGCGITVPVRDAEALAKAILHVVRDRGTRDELARGALRQAAVYSMDAWKERLVELVKEASKI